MRTGLVLCLLTSAMVGQSVNSFGARVGRTSRRATWQPQGTIIVATLPGELDGTQNPSVLYESGCILAGIASPCYKMWYSGYKLDQSSTSLCYAESNTPAVSSFWVKQGCSSMTFTGGPYWEHTVSHLNGQYEMTAEAFGNLYFVTSTDGQNWSSSIGTGISGNGTSLLYLGGTSYGMPFEEQNNVYPNVWQTLATQSTDGGSTWSGSIVALLQDVYGCGGPNVRLIGSQYILWCHSGPVAGTFFDHAQIYRALSPTWNGTYIRFPNWPTPVYPQGTGFDEGLGICCTSVLSVENTMYMFYSTLRGTIKVATMPWPITAMPTTREGRAYN